MDQFGQARQLTFAVFLMGVVNAGCATASLADGDRPHQEQASDLLPFEAQLDTTSTMAQAQADEPPTHPTSNRRGHPNTATERSPASRSATRA